MRIERRDRGDYVAKGSINDRFFIGIGATPGEAFDDAADDHYAYVRRLFGTTGNSSIGNIPYGYSSDGHAT